jgi:cytochrome c oxidase assembly protein subunit 11
MDDKEAKLINEITLSYTFHETPLPEQQAALAQVPVKPIN